MIRLSRNRMTASGSAETKRLGVVPNWFRTKIQNLPGVSLCGFDSHLPHNCLHVGNVTSSRSREQRRLDYASWKPD